MKYDKVYYLKEFLRSYFIGRYEPYDLFNEFCENEYEWRKQEENIKEDFEEWVNKNIEFLSEMFWEDLKETITNEVYGEGDNKFKIEIIKDEIILVYLDGKHNLRICGMDGNYIRCNLCIYVDIKTGKIDFDEKFDFPPVFQVDIDILSRWLEWEDKGFVKYALDVLGDYFYIDYIEECNNDYLIFESGYNTIKIYKKKVKVEFLDLEEWIKESKEVMEKLESLKDEKSIIIHNL